MSIEILLCAVFLLAFIYSIFRPSKSIFSKFFLTFGSILGFISAIGEKYIIKVANFLGVGRETDLIIYLALVVIFFFIFYTLDLFTKLKEIYQLCLEISPYEM
jgi:hypothetical protein